MTKRNGIFLIGLLFLQCLSAQEKKDSLAIQFHLKFYGAQIAPNQKYVSAQHDTLQIETFRFYITNIQIQYTDNSIMKFGKSQLVDLKEPATQRIPLNLHTERICRQISFSVGVDSLSNVSGALSGDLDPAKGMYWAWQSGYINMKIEGKSPSCKTRKNEFHFHIGGYLKPNNALRIVILNVPNEPTIDIAVDASSSKNLQKSPIRT